MKLTRRILNTLLFSFCLYPLFSHASVVISEVAWMGSTENHNAEWIELYNDGGDVDLTDWKLEARDGQPAIALSGILKAGTYALLERTSDDTVPSVPAYLIYTGSMSNDGEYLELRNENGVVIDKVDGSDGWSTGGDNETKETLQRSGNPPVGSWITGSPTPEGDEYVASQSQSQEDKESTEANKTASAGNIIYPQSQKKEKQTKLKPALQLDIGSDRTVIVGVPSTFSATTYTESGREAGGVQVEWNFGDGYTAEGKEVSHTYLYEGDYVVTVSGVRNNFTHAITNEESIVVHAINSPVHIEEATTDYIALANESAERLELSGCVLVSGSVHFKIPKDTYVLGNSVITLSKAVTGIDGRRPVSFFNETGVLLSRVNEPASNTQQRTVLYQASTQKEMPQTKNSSENSAVMLDEEVEIESAHSEVLALASVSGAGTEDSRRMWWWILGLITAIVTSIIAVILVRQEQVEVIEGYYIESKE